MKKIDVAVCLLLTAAICVLGCKKESNNFLVEFKLQLLNTQGSQAIIFNRADTIVFELQVINHTSEEIHLSNFVPGLICNSESDFLKIYSNTGSEIGRPCTPVCTYEGIFILQPAQTRKLQLRWPSTINDCQTIALPAGSYTTSASYTFTIEGGKYAGQRSVQLLNADFKIK